MVDQSGPRLGFVVFESSVEEVLEGRGGETLTHIRRNIAKGRVVRAAAVRRRGVVVAKG